MNMTGKRYAVELFGALIAYVVALVACLLILRAEPPALLRYFVALLPVLPVAYGVLAYARYLRGIDELQRRIQLDGLAFAVGGAGLITVTWGFLELAGLPRLPVLWVFPILVWLWGLGTALASRRYQ
jgi:hypothetical protein